MGNNIACKTVGIGCIRMKIFDRQVQTLKDVRYIPNLRKNLLSLRTLKAQGCKFSGTDGAPKVTKGSILKAERTVNLYKVIGSTGIGDASIETDKKDTTRLWHMHLGHKNERGFQALYSKGVLPGIKYCKPNLCKFCIMSRQSRVAFITSVHKIKCLLDLIHVDVWEPSPVTSVGGTCYYVTFIGDFFEKVWVYFLK